MANKSFANVNNLTILSKSTQTPQTVAESSADGSIVLFPIVERNIDEQIFDVELTQPQDFDIYSENYNFIPKGISESKQIPQIVKSSPSQPAFYRTGEAFNIASASASVRAVNSPTIVNSSYKVSAITPIPPEDYLKSKAGNRRQRAGDEILKPEASSQTLATDFKEAKVFDNLPAINLSRELKVISESKQIPKIETMAILEATPVEELAIDYVLEDKQNALSEKVSTLKLTDADVTVGGIGVSNTENLQTDLDNIISLVFSTSDDQTESETLEFEADSLIAPMIIANKTLEASQNGDTTSYFAFGRAIGGDGFDPIQQIDDTPKGVGFAYGTLGFEDLPNLGDRDFNDVVITIDNFSDNV